MYTLRDTQKHNVRNSDMKQIQHRTQLMPFFNSGARVTVRGFLESIRPHRPTNCFGTFWNPVFQNLQIVGHDVFVDHAHIREMDFFGRRSAVDKLQECVSAICQFTAKIGQYPKRDKQTGRRITDYRFTDVDNTVQVSEEDQYDYEHWCYGMGFLTPPSTEGRFADDGYSYAKDNVPTD